MRRSACVVLTLCLAGCGDRDAPPAKSPPPATEEVPVETPVEPAPLPEDPVSAPPPPPPDPDRIDLETFLALVASEDVDERERAVYRLRVDFGAETLTAAADSRGWGQPHSRPWRASWRR